MTLEQHIEELRAEARNAATPEDRRQLNGELELAIAELEVAIAELDGRVSADPPF